MPVLRRLRVAYFSTGDEILSLGEPPREGAVYDSNRYTVFGLLTRLGCEVIDLGLVRDDPAALEAALRRAAARPTPSSPAAASASARPTTRAPSCSGSATWPSGASRMRPGRPMAVGLIPHGQRSRGPAVLFGLPGNPVAVMVTFLAFVRPALLRMMGCNAASAAPPPLLRATQRRRRSARSRAAPNTSAAACSAVPGALPEVRIAGNQGSGVLSSMVEANGLVVLHHDAGQRGGRATRST